MKNKAVKVLMILTCIPFLFSCQKKENVSGSEDVTFEAKRPSYDKEDRSSEWVINDNYRNFYHIFVPSFADSNGDGIGDLQGIIAKLNYLRKEDDPHGKGSLGINGLLLSPVFASTQYHAYDTVDYYKVKEEFGTNDDLKELIDKCHERGIKVLLDMALNHASTENPDFRKAEAYLNDHGFASFAKDGLVSEETKKACPETAYFRITKPGTNLQYLTGYANSIFSCPDCNALFEGFSSCMPDWNLDNQEVREKQKEVLYHYLDLGVDGFRLDAVTSYYSDKPKRNYEYINYLNKEIKEKKKDAYIVAEGPWDFAGCHSYVENTDIDSYFDFDTSLKNAADSAVSGLVNRLRNYGSLDESPSSLQKFLESSGREAKIRSDHIDATFNSNHDIGRFTNQFIAQDEFKKNAAKFFYGLQNLYIGNYFNYYGDEIGLMGVTGSGNNADMAARSPLIWGDEYTTKELRSGLNDDFNTYIKEDAKAQIEDESSLFNYMRRLYKMKEDNPEIARAPVVIKKLLKEEKCLIITKTWNSSTIDIVINGGSEKQTLDLEELNLSKGKLRNCLSVNDEYAEIDKGRITVPSLSITVIR